MESHELVQFDALLAGAASRFAERAVTHYMGYEQAQSHLSNTGDAEVVAYLGEFVEALMDEALLDNVAGYLFILGALERQVVSIDLDDVKVSDAVAQIARSAFSRLLLTKAVESLNLQISFGFQMGAM